MPDDQVKLIEARLKRQGTRRGGEALMPIYNGEGEVTGYERSMAPERLDALDRNTHLGEMIGAWAGRQAEEELAEGFNRGLVNQVKKVWDEGRRARRQSEFVDLSDPDLKDPVLRDAWRVIPAETKDQIKAVFGDDGFMVRK